jgi:hypothetical protein
MCLRVTIPEHREAKAREILEEVKAQELYEVFVSERRNYRLAKSAMAALSRVEPDFGDVIAGAEPADIGANLPGRE